MAISGRCGDTEVLEWEWRGHFGGCFTVLGHLAFVVIVVGTYSPFNINFLNKKDVSSRHALSPRMNFWSAMTSECYLGQTVSLSTPAMWFSPQVPGLGTRDAKGKMPFQVCK